MCVCDCVLPCNANIAAGVPLACAEASIVLLLFDLSRRATLSSLRQWASAAATVTSSARPILVGTKWDFFCNLPESEQVDWKHVDAVDVCVCGWNRGDRADCEHMHYTCVCLPASSLLFFFCMCVCLARGIDR